MPKVTEIYSSMRTPPDKEEKKLIEKAYDFAREVHREQRRHSGNPYFVHLFETAKNLARFGMDAKSIAAGLLHDSMEDQDVSEEEIKKQFGEEVLFLVQGVTKLGTLKYKGLKRHVESLRKLFVAMSEDIRVLIIKLIDRLHNMQTLEHVPDKKKRKRIASETLEIYAPLAHRLSMGELSKELQDLSFKYVKPKKYREIKEVLEKRSKEKIRELEKLSKSIKKLVAKDKIQLVKSDYRIKGAYSFYKKMRKYESVDEIYDIMALRFIVDSVEDCYKLLGLIHSRWKPLPKRIKDYIATPKPNGYQSLHTTIFTGEGDLMEIQIRTPEMHREAEFGAAAHFAYKEGKSSPWIKKIFEGLGSFTKSDGNKSETNTVLKIPEWIKEMKEQQNEYEKPKEFIKNLKSDFLEDRVFVFTPEGDVIDLPKDSTPIDFAYAIHSDIGNSMNGAKINEKLSSIETKLRNGDIVEILTNQNSKPTRKWLNFAKTSNAKRRIKNYLGKNK